MITLVLLGFFLVVNPHWANKREELRMRSFQNCERHAFTVAPSELDLAYQGCVMCAGEYNDTRTLREKRVAASVQYLVNAFLSRSAKRRRLKNNVNETFSGIYKKQVWGSEAGGSGGGSSYGESRQYLESALLRFIVAYNIKTLVDAPCGAVHSSWMRSLIARVKSVVPCFKYHGYDVVPSVIVVNAAAFKNNTSWVRFSEVDLSGSNVLYISGVDAILTRDALQHLSYSLIGSFLRNLCGTDARFLLLGSYLKTNYMGYDNFDGAIGPKRSFQINLLAPPFSFPRPMKVIREISGDKYLVVYEREKLCAYPKLYNFLNKK